MPNCKECKYAAIKLKCLACEQEDEISKEKHHPRQYSEIIAPIKQIPFPQLEAYERTIWILYLANYTEAEIAHNIFMSQSAVSRCLAIIKQKVK